MSHQSQSTKDYLISIAEHLLEQNCEKQAYQKYKRIKLTLMKKQQHQVNLMKASMSCERVSRKNTLRQELSSNVKLKFSSKERFSTTKKRQSLSPITNKRSNIQSTSTKRIPKQKILLFSDGPNTYNTSNKKPNRKKSVNDKQVQNESKLGRKSQLLQKKKLFNQTQTLIQMKLSNNPASSTKSKKEKSPLLQQLSAAQYTNDGLINLNVNLNKILKTIEANISQYKDISKSKQSILSQQNILLIKKINKQLTHYYSNIDLCTQIGRLSSFKKEKVKIKQTEAKGVSVGKDDVKSEIDNLFSFAHVITPQKQKPHQKNSSYNQQNTQPNFNVNIQKQLQTIKKSYRQKQNLMEQKVNELKKDNRWLVENIEKLLNENTQLKAILQNSR